MRSSFVAANGIDLHVLDWEPGSGNGEAVVLLHGFMDAASTWDITAEILKNAGCTVFAPYLRGFGRSGRVGYPPPDEDERLSAFKSLERFELPDAGHMMHWTEPQKLAARLVMFFKS